LFDARSAPLPRGVKAPKTKRKRGENAEDLFARQCREYGLPAPIREHRFAKGIGRQWRFDFAFHDFMLAVEIEGLVVANAMIGGKKRLVSMGRHAHADGFREDNIKYASAAVLGWTVLRFDPRQVKDGTAIEYTQRVLAARGWKNPGDPNS
jgi:very-short-patch-repair endonuclease